MTIPSYFEPPPTPTQLHIVEGVLRLSLKYDVQYLRQRAMKHLTSTFPHTFNNWKSRDSLRTIPPIDNTPFAAFRIATEFQFTWLLPSILYCMSSHPIEKTLDGVQWQDDHLELSWVDKRMALIGRAKILASQSRKAVTMAKVAGIPAEGCRDINCSLMRARCADTVGLWEIAGILDYFEDNSEAYSANFCSKCLMSFKEQCEDVGRSFWEELPGMFELPGWTELERHKVLSSD